jgi:hypothetical protein
MEHSTLKDDFSRKPARFIGREESSDQAYVFWHAGARRRAEGQIHKEFPDFQIVKRQFLRSPLRS